MKEASDYEMEALLREYEKLKEEQISRIGFRDNLIYVTLTVFGAIFSFALLKQENIYALLVVPWTSLILGWTYLVNDEKITAIGRYIRYDLSMEIKKRVEADNNGFFNWELAHRNDGRRMRRKVEQWVIDEVTFVVSGVVSLAVFLYRVYQPDILLILVGLELALLIILGIEMTLYADLAKGR